MGLIQFFWAIKGHLKTIITYFPLGSLGEKKIEGSLYQRGAVSEGGNHDFTRVGARRPLKKTEAASLPRPARSGQL